MKNVQKFFLWVIAAGLVVMIAYLLFNIISEI